MCFYRRFSVLFLCMLSLLAVCLLGLSYARSASADQIQEELAQSILRFHVIANSDSEEDQALKLLVRDAVLEEARDWTASAKSREEAMTILTGRMADIQDISQRTLQKAGSDASVTVSLETCEFPIKTYGDLTFPAGTYEALRIEIGASQGKNWWCVLYPPLCFLDASDAQVGEDSKALLEEALSEEAYDSLDRKTTKGKDGLSYGKELAEGLWSGKVKLKLKVWEWVKGWFE